ncbi:hypothetical protein CLU79DRAFT_849417 [Phycomyces nitens]|nr:hypothetical protein CLU79DRAFT_849417 [Phycomyces nitens]
MELVERPLPQPSVESDWTLSPQDVAGESDGDIGGTHLTESDLVPSDIDDVCGSSSAFGQAVHSPHLAKTPWPMKNSTLKLTVFRLSSAIPIDLVQVNRPSSGRYFLGNYCSKLSTIGNYAFFTVFASKNLINFWIHQNNPSYSLRTMNNHKPDLEAVL